MAFTGAPIQTYFENWRKQSDVNWQNFLDDFPVVIHTTKVKSTDVITKVYKLSTELKNLLQFKYSISYLPREELFIPGTDMVWLAVRHIACCCFLRIQPLSYNVYESFTNDYDRLYLNKWMIPPLCVARKKTGEDTKEDEEEQNEYRLLSVQTLVPLVNYKQYILEMIEWIKLLSDEVSQKDLIVTLQKFFVRLMYPTAKLRAYHPEETGFNDLSARVDVTEMELIDYFIEHFLIKNRGFS